MVAQIRIRDGGGTLRTLSRVRMRDGAGVLRFIKRIRVRDGGGTLRTVWQALDVSVSPPNATGNYRGSSVAPQNISTASVVASPVGGFAPFTYAWSEVGASAYSWTISAPAGATTKFTAAAVGIGENATQTFRVVVTDSTGNTATTEVTATVLNLSTG